MPARAYLPMRRYVISRALGPVDRLRAALVIVFGMWMAGGAAPADELKPFHSQLGHGIRMSVLSRLTPSAYSDLLEKIVAIDRDAVFDHAQFGVNVENADLLLVILSKASDASSLPGREYFSQYFDDVAKSGPTTAKRTFVTETLAGAPFLLVFYNLEAIPHVNTDCLAEDVMLEATSGDMVYKTENFPCVSLP